MDRILMSKTRIPMTIQQSAILSIIKLILDDAFQSRHKLLPTAFMRMKKLPFYAVVGMVLRLIKQSLQISCNWLGELIDSEELVKEFGRCSTEGAAKESPPMARISEFADIALKLVISGKIVPYKVSEEVLAGMH